MTISFLDKVGKTPLVRIKIQGFDNINLFAKLELYNPTGSVKDRAASYIIKKLLELKEIDSNTTLIESSSGNFGVSLSTYCHKAGIKFYCVIDNLISPINEFLIESLCTRIYKVTERDDNGGYLLGRIQVVNELKRATSNSYWVNQYKNPYNAEAYYHSLGNELCDECGEIDYIFIGVSSGGTITGLSQKIKERFPNAKVIAVDVIGSIIFGGKPSKRNIPGIGSSMVPEILKHAKIDEVVEIDELSTIENCHYLLKQHSLFVGGSSGSVLAAIKKYFSINKITKNANVVTIFCDRGDRYFNTIYNSEWIKNTISNDTLQGLLK